MNEVVNLFDVSEIHTTQQGLLKLARMVVANRNAKEGVGGWVHSLAVPFNNPSSPMLAAKNFENYMNSEIEIFYKSTEAKALVGLKDSDVKLTGSGPLSGAFRKIRGAMSLGGDLIQLPTISQCEKFQKEANEAKIEAETAAGIRKEVELKYLKQGLVAGTPEFEKAVADEMGLVLQTVAGTGSKKDADSDDDEWDKIGKEMAVALRQLAIDANQPQTAHEIAESAINKLIVTFQKTLHNNAVTKGLIPSSAAA